MSAINIVDMRRGIAFSVLTARTKAGMTRRQLADEAGVAQKTILELEDRGTLSLETLAAVAYALDVTLDELVPVTLDNGEF